MTNWMNLLKGFNEEVKKMANDRKTFALYVHTGLEEDQHFKLDIPLDATLDDLKKIINDKKEQIVRNGST